MKNRLTMAVILSSPVFILLLAYLSSQYIIVSSNENYKVWIWNKTGSSYFYENSIYTLNLNATLPSSWESVIIQKGLLPHKWIYLGNPLENELNLHFLMTKTLFAKIKVKLGGFGFYGEETEIETYRNGKYPIIKIGIALWIHIGGKYDGNDDQFCVDKLLFIAYRENGETKIVECDELYWHGSPTDNDYHAQYLENIFTNNAGWIDKTIDLGAILDKAFTYYNFDINRATIKCVQIYVEGVYSHCQLQIGYFTVYYKPSIDSPFTILSSLTISLVAGIFLTILTRKIKIIPRFRRPPGLRKI